MNSLQHRPPGSSCESISGGAIALRTPITGLPHATGRPVDRVAHELRLVALLALRSIIVAASIAACASRWRSSSTSVRMRRVDQLANRRSAARRARVAIVLLGAHHLVGIFASNPPPGLVAGLRSRPLSRYNTEARHTAAGPTHSSKTLCTTAFARRVTRR